MLLLPPPSEEVAKSLKKTTPENSSSHNKTAQEGGRIAVNPFAPAVPSAEGGISAAMICSKIEDAPLI